METENKTPETQETDQAEQQDNKQSQAESNQAEKKDEAKEHPKAAEAVEDKRPEDYESLKAELTALKNEKAVLDAGVSPEFAEFVAFKAGQAVTKDKDFGTALKEWLEANPTYSGKPQAGSWGMRQGRVPGKADGVEAAFSKLNPDLKI